MYSRIIFIVLLLLLAGCSEDPDDSPIDASKYFKGKEGIVMEFVKDAPPEKVYEGMALPVILNIRNKGAIDSPSSILYGEPVLDPVFEEEGFDPMPGRITLSYDKVYLEEDEDRWDDEIEEAAENIRLTGNSDLMPGGEEKQIDLPLKTRKIFGQLQSPEVQLYANICYPYATVLQAEVCMDSSTNTRDLREHVCEARDLSFSHGQGAPLAITRVEVDMIPTEADGFLTRPRFVFHVRNVGQGHVVKAITEDNHDDNLCTLSDQRRVLSTVFAKAYIAGVEMECSPNPFRIVNDEAKFFCSIERDVLKDYSPIFSRQDNYMTNLNLKMYYTYARSESIEIEIERFLPEGFEDDFEYYTGDPLPWLDDEGRTNCEAKNEEEENEEGEKLVWSCSCTMEECNEKLGSERCDISPDLCGPMRGLCCIKTLCRDFESPKSCTDSVIGCVWCKTNRFCTKECENCEIDNFVEVERVCEIDRCSEYGGRDECIDNDENVDCEWCEWDDRCVNSCRECANTEEINDICRDIR